MSGVSITLRLDHTPPGRGPAPLDGPGGAWAWFRPGFRAGAEFMPQCDISR